MESDDGGVGLASRLDWTAPSSGTYFAAVRGFDENYVGRYTLEVSGVDEVIDFDDDHGNDSATATAIGPGVFTGSLEIPADTDWFSFTGFQGAEYVLETTLDSLQDSVLRIYDTDGTTVLVENDDFNGLASRIEWTAPRFGTYYASVLSYDGNSNGTYRLAFEGPEAIPEDSLEPNNSVSFSTYLGAADREITNLSLHTATDEDFYAWNAPLTGILNVADIVRECHW